MYGHFCWADILIVIREFPMLKLLGDVVRLIYGV